MSETIERGGEIGDWSLLTKDGDVMAVRTVPHQGQTIYSTEDRPNRSDKRSEFQLGRREVVRCYVEESDTDETEAQLLGRVREALDDGREEPTRTEPADFGGGESTGVQDL